LGLPDVPDPPDSLQCAIFNLPKGTILHRIHDRRFAGNSFNPGLGESRFAPFTIGGATVPTAYAASSLECAIFESIFHDIDPTAAFKSVPFSKIEPLDYSMIELERDVPLASLFVPDLMSWRVSRSQLIDTPRSLYPRTRLWSARIYEAPQGPHGMVWTSRAFDQERAMILFGTRVASPDIKIVSTVRVTADANCYRTVQWQSARANILIAR